MLQLVGGVIFALVVSVQSVQRPPSIEINPSRNIYFKPRESLEIPCVAEGNPKPSYRWTRNGMAFNPSGNDKRVVQLPNSGTLVFSSPEEKDEGIYQCFAKNNFGVSVSEKCNLRVAKLRDFAVQNDVIHTAQLGLPYTLPCVPPESIPKPDVIWIIVGEGGFGFDAVNYDQRVSMDKEYRLRFANIEKEDEQNGRGYACLAMNPTMRKNVQSHLHIIKVTGSENYNKAGTLWSDPYDLYGFIGEKKSMMCIFSGNPTPEINWKRTDGKPLSKRARKESYSQVLVFDSLRQEDAGSYNCWGTNAASGGAMAQRNFNLRVGQRPYFVKEPQNVETGVGANVEFDCLADGEPEAEYNWTINGLKLTDPKITSKHKFSQPVLTKLFFPDLKETDRLVIQCNASNKYGYVFADAFLNVLQEAPEIIIPPKPLVVSAEGLDVNLTCKTSGKPDPIITWRRDGVQVTGGRFNILTDGTLQIQRTVLADASIYTCDAVNINGSATATGTLIIRRKTRIEQKPGDLERTAGMDAKFTCSGTTDPEEVDKLRIYWKKDGDEIVANDQRTTTNYQDNSLTISGTIVRDSGTYTCVATNGLDEAMASAVLTVRDRPDPPLNVYQLDCNKNVTIKWTPGSFNNAPLQYYILQYNTSFNPDQWTYEIKINRTLTLYSFELSPWVKYNFRLVAVNKIGESSPSAHTPRECESNPDRPEYHPKNLRTLGHQRNTLYIEWTTIPRIKQNAPGFNYVLSFSRVGDNSNNAIISHNIEYPANHYEYETGYVYARYQITIKSSNNKGEAQGDPPTIIGHSFEDTPIIIPTKFAVEEEGDTYALFSWDFPKSEIGKIGTKIRGEFMGFRIQFWQRNYKELTIREYHVGPEVLTNDTASYFVSRVGNMIPNTYLAATIAVRNQFYIGKSSDSVEFKTKHGLPGPVNYFRVRNYGDTHVNLEWGSPLENRGDLVGYDITYQTVDGLELGEMQDRQPQIDDPYTTNGLLSGLQPKRKYRVYVYARTISGRGEGYFIEIITTKPVPPSIPDFTIPNVGSTYINVSWWVDVYKSSGSIIYVEYRQLDGAEWLRTSDEVVHTWQNISNLEPGTEYEVRIKATNGIVSIPSSIEEVKTHGNARAYDLVENVGWFVGVLLGELILFALIILFALAWKQGFRFEYGNRESPAYNSSAAYSGTYDNTRHINDMPEPKGYNNDYYDDKDNYDYDDGGSINKPPSYSSENGHNKPSAPDYEDYDRKPSRNYDQYQGEYEDQDYDHRDYDDRRNDGYDYDNRDYDGYDYDQRDDDYYGRGNGQRSVNVDDGYDYDSEDTGRRPKSKGGAAPSTFV